MNSIERGTSMATLVQDNKRIQFMDGYELYPDKHVLLGHTIDYADESGIESGVVLAVADRIDRDSIWNLFNEYLMSGEHGKLCVMFYGDIYASGVYA
jgi:hypothetical protein